MTNNELRKKIAGCFGQSDLLFNLHSADSIRAKELASEFKNSDLKIEDLEDAISGYLLRNSNQGEHIIREFQKARSFFLKA